MQMHVLFSFSKRLILDGPAASFVIPTISSTYKIHTVGFLYQSKVADSKNLIVFSSKSTSYSIPNGNMPEPKE